MAANDVRLDIVIADDGQPATRPAMPGAAAPSAGTPPSAGGPPYADPQADGPLTSIAGDVGGIRALLEAGGGGGKGQGDADGGGGKSGWARRLEQGAEAFEGAAKRFASVAEPLARNDLMKSFTSASDVAAEGLGRLGAYGQAAGAALKSVTAGVEAFGSVVNAFVDRGKELAKYSPDLAASGARAELTGLSQDMKEAEELGASLSRMTDAQTDLIEFLRDALLPIKKWIVGTLAPAVEYFTATLQNIYIVAGDVYKAVEPLADLIGSALSAVLDALGRLLSFLDDQFGLARRRAEKFGAARTEDTYDAAFRRVVEDVIGRGLGQLDRADPVLGGA